MKSLHVWFLDVNFLWSWLMSGSIIFSVSCLQAIKLIWLCQCFWWSLDDHFSCHWKYPLCLHESGKTIWKHKYRARFQHYSPFFNIGMLPWWFPPVWSKTECSLFAPCLSPVVTCCTCTDLLSLMYVRTHSDKVPLYVYLHQRSPYIMHTIPLHAVTHRVCSGTSPESRFFICCTLDIKNN